MHDKLPSNSFDTFFACTIIVAAALIATTFLCSTLQARITSTQDINKDSYLKAIADHIVINPGSPVDWGKSTSVPQDFGLAKSASSLPYELDMDKISRLNTRNDASINYAELSNAARLNNLALGITVSQLLSITIEQTENHTVGSDAVFIFQITASIDSKLADASLRYYVTANDYLTSGTQTVSNGNGAITVQVPITSIDHALLVLFGRANSDERMTSYAIYRFSTATQQSQPSNSILALSPRDNLLFCSVNSADATIDDGYVFSYAYQSSLTQLSATDFSIPEFLDNSPLIIVVSGLDDGLHYQEWVSYPQVPLAAGSDFEGSERNIFSYLVTISGVLYRIDVSLGDVNH